MESQHAPSSTNPETRNTELRFDLGEFEGFNFRTQSAIDRLLTAQEVVDWDHDEDGEAEFWSSGDRRELVIALGGGEVTASELLALDRLLQAIGDDSIETFLKIHYAVNVVGADLATLTPDRLEDNNSHVFRGRTFIDVRKEAAYELFELYWPEAYQAWESSCCDGLIFDTDRFLDSPMFWVEEINLGAEVALIVVPQ